jgi:glycosyltransferase involved in cell wall biosynthesis
LGSAGRRVLIIVQNLTVPFDRRVWLESRTLAAAGYDVTVVCPTGGPYTAREETLEGIRILRYPAPPPTTGTLSYLWEFLYCWVRTAWIVMRVARRRGIDLVHACNPPDTYFALAALLKPRGVRFVFDQHDLCPEVYTARFGRGHFWHRMLLWLERLTYRTADVVISTNESYREKALQRGRVPLDRVFVVRSAPDRGRFQPVSPDEALRDGRPHRVAYLGVMAPQDGVDYFIRSAAHMVHDLRREDIGFTLIGSGDCFDDLVEQARRLGLDDHVRFTGRIPDEEVGRHLCTADVCVSPDPLNDLNDLSTMNKILEYMALGRAIVAFDLKETKVSAGDGALYAKPNDVEDFARKILRLVDDPGLREEMGRRNLARFRDHLSWEFSAVELVRAYQAALDLPPRGRAR